jgi:hypothetical protein
MLRKLLLTSASALALVVPLAAAPKADAHDYRDYRHGHRHEACYRVYVRDACRPGWAYQGEFHSRRQAERVAESYRCRGFAVSIR